MLVSKRYRDIWDSASIHRPPGQDIPEESQAGIDSELKDIDDARAAGFKSVREFKNQRRQKDREEGGVRAVPKARASDPDPPPDLDLTQDPPAGKAQRKERLAWLPATRRSAGTATWDAANPKARFGALKGDKKDDLASELAPRGEMDYNDLGDVIQHKIDSGEIRNTTVAVQCRLLTQAYRVIMSTPGIVPNDSIHRPTV